MTARGWLGAAVVAVGLLILPLAFAPALTHLTLTFMKVDLMAFGGGGFMCRLDTRTVAGQSSGSATRARGCRCPLGLRSKLRRGNSEPDSSGHGVNLVIPAAGL